MICRQTTGSTDSNNRRPDAYFPRQGVKALGRLHSMASGSFRDAKLERPVSGAELRRLLVAFRPLCAHPNYAHVR